MASDKTPLTVCPKATATCMHESTQWNRKELPWQRDQRSELQGRVRGHVTKPWPWAGARQIAGGELIAGRLCRARGLVRIVPYCPVGRAQTIALRPVVGIAAMLLAGLETRRMSRDIRVFNRRRYQRKQK